MSNPASSPANIRIFQLSDGQNYVTCAYSGLSLRRFFLIKTNRDKHQMGPFIDPAAAFAWTKIALANQSMKKERFNKFVNAIGEAVGKTADDLRPAPAYSPGDSDLSYAQTLTNAKIPAYMMTPNPDTMMNVDDLVKKGKKRMPSDRDNTVVDEIKSKTFTIYATSPSSDLINEKVPFVTTPSTSVYRLKNPMTVDIIGTQDFHGKKIFILGSEKGSAQNNRLIDLFPGITPENCLFKDRSILITSRSLTDTGNVLAGDCLLQGAASAAVAAAATSESQPKKKKAKAENKPTKKKSVSDSTSSSSVTPSSDVSSAAEESEGGNHTEPEMEDDIDEDSILTQPLDLDDFVDIPRSPPHSLPPPPISNNKSSSSSKNVSKTSKTQTNSKKPRSSKKEATPPTNSRKNT